MLTNELAIIRKRQPDSVENMVNILDEGLYLYSHRGASTARRYSD